MEQNLNQSGLKNLNPMAYWSHVLKTNNVEPVFLIIDEPKRHDKLIKLLKEFPSNKIVLETETMVQGLTTSNILYRAVGRTKSDIGSLDGIDYIFCDKLDFDNWIPAGLSGVTPIFTLKTLKTCLNDNSVPDKVKRVENFEKTRETLDNLLML